MDKLKQAILKLNWSKPLTAALIAVVVITPVFGRAQSSSKTPARLQPAPNVPPKMPTGSQSDPSAPAVQSLPDNTTGNEQRVIQAPVNYIGKSYLSLPLGLQDFGSWLVGEPIGGRLYNLARVQTGQGQVFTTGQEAQKQMLWLEIIVLPDSQGRAAYQVLDVLNLPQIQNSEVLAGSAGLPCKQNGVFDPELVTIAKNDGADYWRQIKRAWRANRKTGKFEEIAPGNIVCDNTGRKV